MTNGTLITPKNVKEIVSQIDSIDISLDGADEESCAVIRGKGVFEKVVSSIKLLQSHGFSKITQTSHIENGKRSLKNQYFSSQNSFQAAL